MLKVILEGGNILTEAMKGGLDVYNNDGGSTDHSAGVLGLAGAVLGLIGNTKDPFIRSLSTALGINVGVLGVMLGTIQLAEALQRYEATVTGSATAAERAEALENLADKTAGVVASIGGAIAAIPGGQVLGIAIWLGASLAQQTMNGNMRRSYRIITDELASLLGANNDYINATRAQPRRDPLTLDLDGDGLETLSAAASGVLFDHDGDGMKNGTGWVGSDDGFLVLDRNGNGNIDNGIELFGDSTPLSSGGKASDGFSALRDQDTNSDGVVDKLDLNWDKLRVWRDLNQDGISQPGELFTLDELGIVSFKTQPQANSQVLVDGNRIADLGSYTRADGRSMTVGDVGEMADIDLSEDTFYRDYGGGVAIRQDVKTLPDMLGSGRVRDLREAASLDSPAGAALREVLTDYAAAESGQAQLAMLDTLVEAWARTSDLDYDGLHNFVKSWQSQHPNATVALTSADEHLLAITSIFSGNAHPETLLTAGGTLELWAVRRDFLQRSLSGIKEAVYTALLGQTRLKPYLQSIETTVDENGTPRQSFDKVYRLLADKGTKDIFFELADLVDLNRILTRGGTIAGGWDGWSRFEEIWLSLPETAEKQAFAASAAINLRTYLG
ncbi:hypothetical protein LBW62_25100, partial [Ralstonia solanacearum]|nr:hypothetical protein [Ralstonia solanacearum]MDB0559442.1 hypothetical protein [Ralstonia solanacearum]